jgi:hypothetical protein
MRDELELKLRKDYPKIFANQHESDAVYYGIECRDGWYPIINALCKNIQHYLNCINEIDDAQPVVEQVVVAQIKEKFGALRFYYDGGDDRIIGMVEMAEEWSTVLCEQCGSPGKLRGKGWMYTACDTHTSIQDLE